MSSTGACTSACVNVGAYFDPSAKSAGALTQFNTSAGTSVLTYITGPVSATKYVVICPDVFGTLLTNAQHYADELSQGTGARVLLLNYFKEGPIDPNGPLDFSKFPAWLAANPHEFSAEKAAEVVATLHKEKETYHTESIVVIGFCYGAKASLPLFQKNEYPLLKAAVWDHPSFFAPEDAQTIVTEKKYLIHTPIDDHSFKPAIREAWEKTVAERKAPVTIKIYEGVNHGFVMRPNNEKEKETGVVVLKDTIEFIKTIA